jgi:uncharacterized protein YbjT (DUF2867 family)
MKVLLAGANNYIAKSLIHRLLDQGHEVVCQVRDKTHFQKQYAFNGIQLIQGDLLRERSIEPLPYETDVAFYLVNSLSQTSGFAGLEALSATNFIRALNNTNCKQIITLSEICGEETDAGVSRRHIEEILSDGQAALTAFKTGMVIGPGTIALEMLQELTRKSTIIIPQKWATAKIQPIALEDVIGYLMASMLNKNTYKQTLEIGGPDVVTFRQLLFTYTHICKKVIADITTLPYLSFKIVSHWLNLLTPLSYPQAQALIESLEFDSFCHDNSINQLIPISCTPLDKILEESCLTSTLN